MKHLSIFTLLAIMLAACGTSTASENSSSAAARNGDFAFLKKLGFNLNEIPRFDSEVVIDYEKNPFVAMTNAQQEALLDVVGEPFRAGEDIEGVFSIIGIRALPNDHTLILYNVEFGDGASKVFAIYDRDGKTIDYIDSGYWGEMHPIETNENYTEGVSYGDDTKCIFDSPSTMVLKRKFNKVQWANKNGDINIIKEFWCIDKNYNYTITDKGILKLNNIEVKKQGPVEEHQALMEEISDLTYLSYRSDEPIFDRLNALAMRPEIKRYLANSDDDISYRLQGVVQGLYSSKPQQLLQWMSQHRDLSKNAVTGLLEQCFSSGWIAKETLIELIEQMPNGDAKQYIEELTAQWGPADAVG